jgi:hypothetical protein
MREPKRTSAGCEVILPATSATAIAARLELQPVRRYLEVEAPAVNGCRQRQHGRLERCANPAILLERSPDVGHVYDPMQLGSVTLFAVFDLALDSTFAGCRIEAVAGRGGMGAVYIEPPSSGSTGPSC